MNWKALKAKIEGLWAPSLQGRMAIHRTHHATGGSPVARYWITLDDKVIWDYPMHFLERHEWDDTIQAYRTFQPRRGKGIPTWPGGASPRDVDRCLQFYLDTPRDKLMEPLIQVRLIGGRYGGTPIERETDMNQWDIADLLRAADRRVGYLRLTWWAMFELDGGNPARKVLGARFEGKKKQ